MYRTIFFDLDDTLYPAHNGVWRAVRARIEQYMAEEAGIPMDQIPILRERYLQVYGTTLRGLMIDHRADPASYLEYVHRVPIEEMVAANPELKDMLTRLPQQKYVFTNASRAHAWRVLKALSVEEHFAGVVAIEDLNYISKPDASVYKLALQLAGDSPAENSLYLDDRAANLAPARALGMGTVLVGSLAPDSTADHSIPTAEALLEALPWLVK